MKKLGAKCHITGPSVPKLLERNVVQSENVACQQAVICGVNDKVQSLIRLCGALIEF